MQTDPQFVNELRTRFRAGATPSALIRWLAEQHPGEPAIDRLVRAYFRAAFSVPMLRIGKEQVEQLARGEGLAGLNTRVVHQMVATRSKWDQPASESGPQPACWIDSVSATDESVLIRTVEVGTLPELAACWGHLGEEGKRFITRTVASARALHEKVQVLAALAEQLQLHLHAAEVAQTRTM